MLLAVVRITAKLIPWTLIASKLQTKVTIHKVRAV